MKCKIFFSRTTGLITTNLAQSTIGWRGFKFDLKRNHSILKKKIMGFSSPNQRYDIIVCVYWCELFSQVSDVVHVSLVVLTRAWKSLWMKGLKFRPMLGTYVDWAFKVLFHAKTSYLLSICFITEPPWPGLILIHYCNDYYYYL